MGRVDKTKERTKYNKIKIEREYFIIDDKLVKMNQYKKLWSVDASKKFSVKMKYLVTANRNPQTNGR